jgi:cation diffusion facilitator family transporter
MKAAWGGLGVSVIALGLKFAAYWVTGSFALYSDALETTIKVVGALTALIALWFSEQPADANHPYGHQKAEYISAAVEAFKVVATAFAIGREAYSAGKIRALPRPRSLASRLMSRPESSICFERCS